MVTHGTRGTYQGGCRCEECRRANTEVHAAWRAQSKSPGYEPNPNMQKGGMVGARARWGEVPRTVSIRHLSDAQRLEVLAFVRLLEKDEEATA
jgi:hypothetical protein